MLKAFITDTRPLVASSRFMPGEIVLNIAEYLAIFVAASFELYPKRDHADACSIIALVPTPISFAMLGASV